MIDHSIKHSTGRFTNRSFGWLMLEDFISNTGYYPILFTILELNKESIAEYLSDWTHIVLFLGAFLQSALIALGEKRNWRFQPAFHLTMVSLYTLSELIAGNAFFNDNFHLLFWFYSIAFMFSYFLLQRNAHWFYDIVHACLRTSIVFSFYLVYELANEGQAISMVVLFDFLKNPVHLFLASALLMIGILLGISNGRQKKYLQQLSSVSDVLYEYSSWHLGGVLEQGLHDPSIYSLKRRKKLIMFMDIRQFTSFSEKHPTEEVVELLTQFYKNAEQTLNGKAVQVLKFTADEVMCSFDHPEKGIALARELHKKCNQLLAPYHLSAGMALHYGEVLEGLIGGDVFKNFDIMGDSVNTTSRMEKMAGSRIIMSEEALSFAEPTLSVTLIDSIKLRGKEQEVALYAVDDREQA